MSERPIGDELDQLLRSAMSDLADHAPLLPEPEDLGAPVVILKTLPEETQMKNKTWITIGALAAAVLLIIGVVIVSDSDDEPE